ncbi:protein kinase domain-containing protein [Archangium sp.]|uniref:serine/threonine protein kinase n=1 Tax=Archangium sp. TaxID=1872627 RepID=UPI00286D42EC|nr:protein kinase [Archangium sp.]
MQQQTREHEERLRRELARRLRRRLLLRLGRPGAQEEFLPRVGEQVGGFTVEARLGAGSYGTVFRVRRGQEVYALKLLYLPHAGACAFRELEVLLRLHHAGLVRVEAHGHHGHHPEVGALFLYLVMDYVPGLPLDEYVERHNPAASWAAGATLALAAQLAVAHRAGVVHRDIKEDNVVVGEDGGAVLVDFGVGTFPGVLTVSGGLMPNVPSFRAPEAWRFSREAPLGERYEASARDDLWGLGVLLYVLLTGTRPFHGESEEEVEKAVLDTPLVAPHERNPRVPPALSAVCVRLLEKEPGARYADAEAVVLALEEALAGADASWEVPLCEAWSPGNATTRPEGGRWVDPGRARERLRRQWAHARPRRGKPVAPGASVAVPSPVEEAAPEAVPASEPSRASSGAARVGWKARWVLGVGTLLAVAHPHGVPTPDPVDASPPTFWVAVWLPMPEVTPWPGQEVASPWRPLEGDDGAVPSWATTSAPVARATLPEDSPMKTPRQDSGLQRKQSQTQNPASNVLATALCTAAVSGCTGAQVRDTPKPEACPAGSVETMRRLGIRIGEDSGSNFLPKRYEDLVTVREGPGARLVLGEPLGQLSPGTVVTGRLLFGKDYVYGRFTEARTPGGDTFSVCLEAWSAWRGVATRGLRRAPDEGGPGTATVHSAPDAKAVERFE